MKSTFVYALFLACAVISCSNEPEFLNKTVVDKIVYHENVDQVGSYVYTAAGLPSRYEYYFNNKLYESVEYVYSNGKLVKKLIYHSDNNGQMTLVRTDEYTYSSGLVEKVTITGIGYKYMDVIKWHNNRIVEIEGYSEEEILTERVDIDYDAAGNITQTDHYLVEDETEELSYIVQYEFDDKANPHFEFSDPADLVNFNIDKVCPNNLVRSSQRASLDAEPYATTEIEYTYNNSGLPTQRNIQHVLFSSVSDAVEKIYYKKI